MAQTKKTGKKRKWLKRMLIGAVLLMGVVVLGVFAYMQHPKFGRLPRGARLDKIQHSPHYKNGAFENTVPTPMTAEDVNSFTMMSKFLFGDKSKRIPPRAIPSVKRDLKSLDASQDLVVWFGHSSYFMQVGGKRILVDPVFSGAASPVSFTTKAFAGTDVYTVDDLPEIDYLFLTHDHWDHLDYETILKLKPKVGKIICPLGVGEHLEYWGSDMGKVIELQWDEDAALDADIAVHCLTARHFSGRGLSRNRALWAAYVLETPTARIYIGGDSGYGTHFAEAGKRFGTFDLVILENGQYDAHWRYIHMMPEELLQAAADLNARHVLPVHNSKFSISNHDWDDPMRRVANGERRPGLIVFTPIIGEIVDIHSDGTQASTHWWEEEIKN